MIYYQGMNGIDVTVPYYFDFTPSCTGWQFTGGSFSTKYTKPENDSRDYSCVRAIDVYCEYSYQPNGYALFDNIAVVNSTGDDIERYYYYSEGVENGLLARRENIFYKDGKVILFDFDIARFYDPSKTRDTTLLGSVGYAAPEQFGFSQTSVQSDVYSCGKLLQVLLTGRLDQNVKGRFERIIRKTLNMDPKDRFQSAAQLKAELQEIGWIFPGINNRNRKGKVGSWIGWIFSVCVVLSIDTQKNTSFKHDSLYLIACFLVLALLELVICNRHKVQKYDLPFIRWGILSLMYFLLLVIGIGILSLFDMMLPA